MSDNQNPAPVFTQNIYRGGTGAQGMEVTQNIGAAPADLMNLVLQLRNLGSHLRDDQQAGFAADVEILEDPEQQATPRLGAWQRIKNALAQGGANVATAGIVAAGEQIVSSLTN
ncbi:hypothetical protein [Streptomyces fuscichromogenes]|uniref:hypothetical protein n=1 Tax=Streptomyces fuscichromogenes TaxID=1324013 RepID=UPI001670512A|nr:hypothetical protein [Streptomyces fuscichromogenes]